MATEIVTAKAGTNHVDSEDIGALYAGGFGKGRYALDLGNGLKCSMRDANTLVIDTGGIMFDGRFVRVKTAESLTVTNGTQSQYRKDLAVLTYKRDASNNNIETVSWSVLRGTPASSESAAKAPTLTEGSILDGDATASVAVAEVDLAGLTPTCKLLLPTVSSLSSLGESVAKLPVKDWKLLQSAKTSGVVGEWNEKIYMGYEGTTSEWTFIPIRTAWCTVEEIAFDSGGIIVRVNPTYTSSAIQVTLLALLLE